MKTDKVECEKTNDNKEIEKFPKSVKRFSDKNCGKNKELERLTEPNEVKTALVYCDFRMLK